MNSSKAWIVVITAILTVVAVSFVVVSLVFRDTRQDINLADLGHGAPDSTALNGWTDDTTMVCKDVTGCVQGFTSRHTVVRKFDSKQDAHDFATSKPDTRQSNWIVIQYTDPNLPEPDRVNLQEYIDSLAASD